MIKFLLMLLIASLVACKHGPDITICLIDPVNNALQCSDASGQALTIPIKDAENYISVSPDDFKKVLDYCKMTKQPLDFSHETNSCELHK